MGSTKDLVRENNKLKTTVSHLKQVVDDRNDKIKRLTSSLKISKQAREEIDAIEEQISHLVERNLSVKDGGSAFDKRVTKEEREYKMLQQRLDHVESVINNNLMRIRNLPVAQDEHLHRVYINKMLDVEKMMNHLQTDNKQWKIKFEEAADLLKKYSDGSKKNQNVETAVRKQNVACSICFRSFVNERGLKIHQGRKHKVRVELCSWIEDESRENAENLDNDTNQDNFEDPDSDEDQEGDD